MFFSCRMAVLGPRVLLYALLLLPWIVAPVSATDIRGRVVLERLRREAEPPAVPEFRWELQNGVRETLPDRIAAREVAVVLTGHGGATAERTRIPIAGGELKPSTVVVRQGTTLEIDNRDEIPHELVAIGLDGFSAEVTSPGKRRAVHLRTAGHWPIKDLRVPHAHAHLHVLKDLVALAQPDAQGAFVFKDIAPGVYEVHVFHGFSEVASERIDVEGKLIELQAIAPADP